MAKTRRAREGCPVWTEENSSEVQNSAHGGSRAPLSDAPGQISKHTLVLPREELERIRANAHVLTKEEREAAINAEHKPEEEVMDAAEENICMEEIDEELKQALRELEVESVEERERILERALMLKLEQEPEIKQLKSLLLATECRMVWNLQIAEKKRIQAKEQEEERSLYAMIEEDRLKALELQKEIDEKRQKLKIQCRMEIEQHLKMLEEKKNLEQELKKQGRLEMLEEQKKIEMEQLEAQQKKIAEKKKLQLEILKFKEEALLAKERQKEAEMKANRYDQQYERMTQERDEKQKAERKQKIMARLETAEQLLAILERNMAGQTEKELLQIHEQELAIKLDWKKKEQEEAKKKLEMTESLKAGLQEQINFKKQMLVAEAARNSAESERCERIRQELNKQDKENEEQRKQKILQNARELHQQIQEREAQASACDKRRRCETDKQLEEERLYRERQEQLKEDYLKKIKQVSQSPWETWNSREMLQ